MKKINVQNLIIGFGKAGKTLAADLARNGQQVIIAEQSDKMYGGTCINIGCIPSKRLLHEAEHVSSAEDIHTAFPAIIQRKETLVSQLRHANFNKLDSLPEVEVINAKARFIGPHTVSLHSPEQELEVTAERIFINTGSTPARLNIPGADGKHIYDSTGFLSLEKYPSRVVIIGGGYISLEFASMYSALGSSVTIVEAGPTFLPREDRDIANEMQRILESKGVRILLSTTTTAFREEADMTYVTTTAGEITADAVLVAIGRRPNSKDLDLQHTEVKTDSRGYIITDDHLLAADGIWAMGDVAGTPQFTYMSLDDYRIVRDQLLGQGKRSRLNRGNIPTSVFTYPPLSHIGLTETQAIAEGRNIELHKLPATAIPKAKVISQTDGLLKAIVDKESDLILGATLFCAESHELINIIKMAMDNNIPATYLKHQIFTHPTMAEALNDLFA